MQPGEKPAVFGDALRRLGNRARFMHGDLGRYWYSTSLGDSQFGLEMINTLPATGGA